MDISSTRLKNFRQLIAERRLKLSDVADLLGKAPAQVSAFGGKNPTKGIGHKIAREIEAALTLAPGSLDVLDLCRDSDQLGLLGNNKLPILDALEVITWLAGDSVNENRSWISAPTAINDKAFAVRLVGMSMNPELVDGDLVVIDPLSEIQHGDFVLASQNQGPALIRKLSKEGLDLFVHASNPSWPERSVRVDHSWQLIGKAVWNIRTLK